MVVLKISMVYDIVNGAERAGEVVGQNGAGEDISGVGHQFGRKTANTPPNFRGGAEKVVVHMHCS